MVRWRLDVAGTRKTGWGLLRCSHPDGILSPASESSDSGGADSKSGEKLSLGSRKKKKKTTFTPRYLVVPGCDDQLLFVFSQSSLLALTLQFQTRLRFVFKIKLIQTYKLTSRLAICLSRSTS